MNNYKKQLAAQFFIEKKGETGGNHKTSKFFLKKLIAQMKRGLLHYQHNTSPVNIIQLISNDLATN